jgi:hypothetical protein
MDLPQDEAGTDDQSVTHAQLIQKGLRRPAHASRYSAVHKSSNHRLQLVLSAPTTEYPTLKWYRAALARLQNMRRRGTAWLGHTVWDSRTQHWARVAGVELSVSACIETPNQYYTQAGMGRPISLPRHYSVCFFAVKAIKESVNQNCRAGIRVKAMAYWLMLGTDRLFDK